MTNFHDNPFEADGSMHNVRVMRNMMINSASHAFCNQPAIRRADLLDPEHRVSPAGRIDAADQRIGGRDLLQQHDPVGDRRRRPRRTSTGATTCFSAKTRRPRSSRVNTYTNYTSSDYNGFRPNPGRREFVRVELAAVRDDGGLQRDGTTGCRRGERKARDAVRSRRSPSTAGRRNRISTASSSTTTCS